MSETPCEILEWDSNFWGFPIAQVIGSKISDATYPAIASWSRLHSIRCLYLLAVPEDTETALAAMIHGFKLVDERVTLRWPASPQPAPPIGTRSPNLRIRPYHPDDLATLEAIASDSHLDTRFFTDSLFPRSQARELYRRWIRASCEGFADLVLVAQLQGNAIGYCTCHLPTNRVDPGRIGLLAVASAARGRGVARSLIDMAKAWFADQSISQITVVTQDRNVAALNLYRRSGFTIESRRHWYHRWYLEQATESL
jgi:dTDP-4-amino-4,6-dideoxy-D-galactose acyltransferase